MFPFADILCSSPVSSFFSKTNRTALALPLGIGCRMGEGMCIRIEVAECVGLRLFHKRKCLYQ